MGYAWAGITRADKVVSHELIAFRRKEQMRRLQKFMKQLFYRSGI